MEKMKHIDKTSQLSKHKRTPLIKPKRNPVKLILMVQESAKPHTASYRSNVISSLSAQTLSDKYSRATFDRIPQFEDSLVSSFPYCTLSQAASVKVLPESKTKTRITYDELHNQLSKITQELQAEGYNIEEPFNSQRQRRTREERKKKDIPKVEVLEDINFTQQIRNRTQLVSFARTIGGMMPKPELKDSVKTSSHKKENKKPLVSIEKNNQHIVRKYLGDLYSRIVFKVKEIGKKRKGRVSIETKIGYELQKAKSNKFTAIKRNIHQAKKSLQFDHISLK